MRYKILLFAIFLVSILSATDYENYEKRWQDIDKETTSADSLKSEIIQKFLSSQLSFEFCQTEFYDKLYPIWRSDSLKVVAIEGLLLKYPQNQWDGLCIGI